jgi:hypothetical protein
MYCHAICENERENKAFSQGLPMITVNTAPRCVRNMPRGSARLTAEVLLTAASP